MKLRGGGGPTRSVYKLRSKSTLLTMRITFIQVPENHDESGYVHILNRSANHLTTGRVVFTSYEKQKTKKNNINDNIWDPSTLQVWKSNTSLQTMSNMQDESHCIVYSIWCHLLFETTQCNHFIRKTPISTSYGMFIYTVKHKPPMPDKILHSQ